MRGLFEYAAFVVLTALLLAIVSAAYVAAAAHFGRIRKGRCVVRRSAAGEPIIETDLGQFTLAGEGQLRIQSAQGDARAIPLTDVRAARFGYVAKPDLVAELAYGFDPWDLSGRWRDRTEWYEITLITVRGDVPLFIAGQLERREPFMQCWFDLINESLTQWGWRKDVHDESQQALDRVLAAFKSVGKPLPLA